MEESITSGELIYYAHNLDTEFKEIEEFLEVV